MWVVEVRDDSADRLKAVLEGEADVTVTALGVAALDDHIDPVQLFARGIVTMGARTIVFTRREAQVIVHLAAHRDRVVSRAELLEQFWGRDTRSLDVYIRRLRRKLGSAAGVIQTVFGVGYRFVEEGLATQ